MLGVFANDLGASFIDPHLSQLSPGRTVAVGRYGAADQGNLWSVECPTLLIDRVTIPMRMAHSIGISRTGLRNQIITRFLRRHRVSVVLGEYLDEFLEFVPLLDGLHIPYVVQGHGIDVSASLRKPGMAQDILRYRSARAILTRSAFHRDRLIAMGLPAGKVHVNRGGVAIPASVPERPDAAQKRLLTIGRLTPKKGPMYMLEAFRRAAARDPELTLDFVGGGPLLWVARQFVEASGLRLRVRLHGTAPEALKQRLLQECGVFIQHNITDPANGDEEGLPAALQEAMAHGLAVVSTRHAGIPEAVEDGVTGLLTDEGDVAAMAQSIIALADGKARAFGLAGHRRALTHDAWHLEQARLKHWLFDAA